MVPEDPIILLSYINVKLRDYYCNLEELCSDLDIDQNKLIEKLAGIEYWYDSQHNQFK